MLDDLDVRHAAMAYVAEQRERGGGVVTRRVLEAFEYAGERIPLIDQSRGIRNPAQLQATLSILSTPRGPYDDEETPDGLLRYAYRAGASDGGDNRKLRRAVELRLPLILLRGLPREPGIFVPVLPVYLVGDNSRERYVEVALDESLVHIAERPPTPATRAYAERLMRMRLHQPIFRAQVLRAYESQCTICRLRHADLLDAAHIVGDADSGEPVITNGLAMCKIHHAAYDRSIVGIRPDYVVEVREDVLTEVDGPMLRHGIQDVHGWRIQLPRRTTEAPDRDALALRYSAFLGQP